MTETENKWPEPGKVLPVYVCPKCGLTVPYGQEHACLIDRIIELLERIDARLEHLDHNIGSIEYCTRRIMTK